MMLCVVGYVLRGSVSSGYELLAGYKFFGVKVGVAFGYRDW